MILQKGQKGEVVKALQRALGVEESGVFDNTLLKSVATFQRKHALKPDGIAGPKTLTALGLGDLQRLPVPLSERVHRARALLARKLPIEYGMGKGGFDPDDDSPHQVVNRKVPKTAENLAGVTTTLELDCSGWAAWSIGLPRQHAYGTRKWIETTRIHGDATGPQVLFKQIPAPVPGCLVVYPDTDGHEGHVGLVTEVRGGKVKGIDCSSSRDGLSERDFGFFLARGIFVVLVSDPV